MERYGTKDAKAAFARLAKVLGKPLGDPWRKNKDTGKLEPVIGTWVLDSARAYGGFRIEEILESGGVRTPFGNTRMPPREFCDAVHFAIDVLAEYQRTRGEIPPAQGYPANASALNERGR